MRKIFSTLFVLILLSSCSENIFSYLVKGQSSSTTVLFEPRVINLPYFEEKDMQMMIKVTFSVINVQNLKEIHLVMRFNDTMTHFTYYAPWGNLSMQVGGTSGAGSAGTDPSYIKRFTAVFTRPVSGSGSLVVFYLEPLHLGSSQLILLECDLRDTNNNSISYTISQSTVTIEVVSLDTYVDGKYGSLKAEFDSLSANYSRLERNFTILSIANDVLNSNYTELKGTFDSLNADYTLLMENLTILSGAYDSLITNYTVLQRNFDNLNSRYEAILIDLSQTKNIMYFSIGVSVTLAVVSVYFAERKKDKIKEVCEGT